MLQQTMARGKPSLLITCTYLNLLHATQREGHHHARWEVFCDDVGGITNQTIMENITEVERGGDIISVMNESDGAKGAESKEVEEAAPNSDTPTGAAAAAESFAALCVEAGEEERAPSPLACQEVHAEGEGPDCDEEEKPEQPLHLLARNSPSPVAVATIQSSRCESTANTSSHDHKARQNDLNSSRHTGTLQSETTLSDTEESHDFPLHMRPAGQGYLESASTDVMDASLVFNFVMEHRIFLKAALNLLTERDRHAPELGMMDPIVLKSGPLKKASHLMNGVWKVKFVEIRRGMFSYYENNAVSKDSRSGEGELFRKNIPLQAQTCTCRAVKLHQKALNFSPGGAIFELEVNGQRRLWMATSREERQTWMQAINNAMVGGSVTRGDSWMDHHGRLRVVNHRSPYKLDLRKYMKVQKVLRGAETMQEYLTGVRDLLNQSLQVPVRWIARQGSQSLSTDNVEAAFREQTVQLSVDQLWKDLQRDSVKINEELFRGDSPHGPERILGGLMRQLLDVGRAAEASRSDLRVSHALVYARDVLLAANRTRSAGDSYYCVNTLFSNQNLVVVTPNGGEVEPVRIEISEDDSDESLKSRFNDKSGWIKTRNKSQRMWRKLFFVLSEGTLSYYEGASPRPHGLRGQRVLADAKIALAKMKRSEEDDDEPDDFILTMTHKDGNSRERLLLFDDEDNLLDWIYALECVIKANAGSEPIKKSLLRRSSSQEEKGTSLADILKDAELATKELATSVGLDDEAVMNRLAGLARRATSAIRVSIRACTEYKVRTTDPVGDEEEDTWANIRAHFIQAFRITGGSNGRIMRGEEIVRVSVVDCIEPIDDGVHSPSSVRSRMNKRIFRSFGNSGIDLQTANSIAASGTTSD
jgi:hypothetical protein